MKLIFKSKIDIVTPLATEGDKKTFTLKIL